MAPPAGRVAPPQGSPAFFPVASCVKHTLMSASPQNEPPKSLKADDSRPVFQPSLPLQFFPTFTRRSNRAEECDEKMKAGGNRLKRPHRQNGFLFSTI